MHRMRYIATCRGENNLAAALEKLDEEGMEIEFIIWTGLVPKGSDSPIAMPEKSAQPLVNRYTVIGSKPTGPQVMA